ncbi:thermonuclease family protein [Amycolatopsis sp. CA-230715]|uniref:thermonuclease family protein n=1 Tax=Amycolatopsis sp. CA-230715 TaxID=2745196 RepID=UPI001C013429|nr:thermonuclease family protein [Amycolatopsis sp. CA-230715]
MRVIDGDTVAVTPVDGALDPSDGNPQEHVVRLLGLDAPEMNRGKDLAPECGARTATYHLGGILPRGLPVVLEYDAHTEHTDRYGRSLAYIAAPGYQDAGLRQITDGYATPWYPAGKPEPERMRVYRLAADTAVRQHAGAHSQCATVGRGRGS